jgi:hypothetical protein
MEGEHGAARSLRVRMRSLAAPGRYSFIRIWALAAVILFGLCAAWSLSTPIGAANDEGAQVLRASRPSGVSCWDSP